MFAVNYSIKTKQTMKHLQKIIALLLFISVTVTLSKANERRFSYTYESGVLPFGAKEFEIWNTYRTGRDAFYRRLDQRLEFEIGLGSNVQSSIYLNNTSKMGIGNLGQKTSSYGVSISNEWKYKISDPVADPFCFALYGEWALGLDEFELEGKLIFDKKINNTLFAFNAVMEKEWETEIENGEEEIKAEQIYEFDFGCSYLATPNFSCGIELRNHNEIIESEWEHSVLFAGPVLSYATEEWWITLTVLPQLTALKGETSGKLNLSEHEKIESRLLFSFHL